MKSSSILAAAISVIIIVASCAGNRIKHSDPAADQQQVTAGIIADSLTNIDRHVTAMIDAGKIPGAAVLVAKNGRVVYHKAFGHRNIEEGEILDTNDIFRIASMTKPVVSVAIMQLYEKGLLKLSDPVSKYIPSFANPKVLVELNRSDTTWTSRPAIREITIHHLLTHTSGIGYSFSSRAISPVYAKNKIPDLANSEDITIGEVTDRLGSLPLMFDPGSRYSYGLSIDVLGRVVEVVSGMTLGEYIEKNITAPLAMNDTRFFFNEDVTDRLATVYTISPSTRKVVSAQTPGRSGSTDYPVSGARKYFSGGSGLCSTTSDYFVFSQAMLNGGIYKGVRILKPETVKMIFSDQLDSLRFSATSTFGYGFSVDRSKNSDGTPGPVTALGWAGAFNTWFTINPADSIVAIIMSQVFFNPYEQELIAGFRKAAGSAVAR